MYGDYRVFETQKPALSFTSVFMPLTVMYVFGTVLYGFCWDFEQAVFKLTAFKLISFGQI